VRQGIQRTPERATRVLVVADELPLLTALETNLCARGYLVHTARTGAAALALASRHHPQAVILDLGIRDIPGREVIARLRRWSREPVLVLSARGEEGSRSGAIEAGADDYVTKPFGMDQLLARLRAALPGPDDHAVVETGAFTVDLDAERVTGHGREIRLTPIEWGLVATLVHNAGRLVLPRQLLRELWGVDGSDRDGELRRHLARIRRKLEPDPRRPRYFLTEPGLGYRFEAGPPVGSAGGP
jgi:two-component system, OmpR family, KDP operon response regulator KdpE